MLISIYLGFEKELEAHLWWFCNTIEYFKTCEYELQTGKLLRSSEIESENHRLVCALAWSQPASPFLDSLIIIHIFSKTFPKYFLKLEV